MMCSDFSRRLSDGSILQAGIISLAAKQTITVESGAELDGVTTNGNGEVNLTSPNGGEIWSLSSTQAITWTNGGYTGNVKLVLFQNGTKVGNIVLNIPSGASPYLWTVGSYIGGTTARGDGYVVRVISMDGVKRDDGDGPFVIQ